VLIRTFGWGRLFAAEAYSDSIHLLSLFPPSDTFSDPGVLLCCFNVPPPRKRNSHIDEESFFVFGGTPLSLHKGPPPPRRFVFGSFSQIDLHHFSTCVRKNPGAEQFNGVLVPMDLPFSYGRLPPLLRPHSFFFTKSRCFR